MMTKITQIVRTGMGKALIVLWVLALLSLISLPILGIFQHELLGNLAFGFLLSSALVNISIIVSCKVSRESVQLAKGGWLLLGVIILGFTLYHFDGKKNSDVSIFLVWAMLVLSFPVSLVINLFFAGISYLLDNLFPGAIKVEYTYLFIVWLMFFLAGYFQWFKLIPFFLAKFQRARGGPGSGT